MNSRILAMVMLIAFFGTAVAADRAAIRVNTHVSYTDNLFQNYNRRSDWITLAYVDFDYVLRPSMSFYYTGNANVFAEYTDLFSHTHQLGLGYVRPGKGRNALYAGFTTDLRLDRPIYRYYDYAQGSAYVNTKRYLRPTLLAWGGYQVRYRNYLNASDYSFLEQTASLRISRFFQTRTTLQFQGSLGVKTYTHSTGSDSSETIARAQSNGVRTLSQAMVGVKIAQSLTRNTGLQIEYLQQFSIAGHNRFVETEGYNTDDELFDDRYSYESKEARTTVKHIAPWGLQIELTGRYVQRVYAGRPVLDLNGFLISPDMTREDTRKILAVEGNKAFKLRTGWIKHVRVNFEWRYSDIDSNDPYYDTSAQVFSTGLQMGF